MSKIELNPNCAYCVKRDSVCTGCWSDEMKKKFPGRAWND